MALESRANVTTIQKTGVSVATQKRTCILEKDHLKCSKTFEFKGENPSKFDRLLLFKMNKTYKSYGATCWSKLLLCFNESAACKQVTNTYLFFSFLNVKKKKIIESKPFEKLSKFFPLIQKPS